MSASPGATTARPGPGRPPTGARERILDAGLEVLKSDGYAGLTVAKVAARAGENKALIAYHFGSKQGLIAEAGRALGRMITDDVLAGLDGANTVEQLVRGGVDGVWRVLDRDERIARVYFDLTAVSVVEADVRAVMREIKDEWRRVLRELLGDAGVPPQRAATGSVLTIAGIEGLCLERVERGETAELRRAIELFVTATTAAIEG